jgi:hypothetical protein
VITRSRASAAILACTSSRDAQFTSQQKSGSELLGNVSTELFSPQTVMDPATGNRENIMQAGMERSDLEDSACEEESNEEYDEEDEDEEDDGCPPRSHTGGKWKPGDLMTRGSSPSWTRTSSSSTHADEYRGSSTGAGGWSLLLEDCAGGSAVSPDPPPNFTGGKWRPTLPNQAVINAQQVYYLFISHKHTFIVRELFPTALLFYHILRCFVYIRGPGCRPRPDSIFHNFCPLFRANALIL